MFLALLSSAQWRGNLAVLTAGQIHGGIKQNLAVNQWKTTSIICLTMMRSETKVQRASGLCTFKMFIGFFSRNPGNCTSNMLSALTTYAHTCRQWASGILVGALRQGSKCKLKTGVKTVAERIIFLEFVT